MNPPLLPDIGRMVMLHPLPASVLLFASLLLAVEAGRRWKRPVAASNEAVSLLDGAVFALLGLLVAFSFAAAANRFETRRDLIAAEANAIGTAQLRLSLLPPADRAALEAAMAAYVDSRLRSYAQAADRGAFAAQLAEDQARQQAIWAAAVVAVERPDAHAGATILLLPALNEMFDITTTRAQLLRAHNPPLIYVLLWGSGLVAGLLAGHGLGPRNPHGRLHELGFAAVMTLALYVIVDFDYPRLGLIRVDSFDAAIATQGKG